MKAKTITAAVLGASILFGTCGCGITDLSKDSLLHPPKTMGAEAEIEQLIADAAGGIYTLKYPKSGNNRNAIIMRDLDGDSIDEAIAFFRKRDNDTGVHMLVMYKKDEHWNAANDIHVGNTDVDCVDFADLDTGNTLEILVGYTTFTQSVNSLQVYTYQSGTVSKFSEEEQNYTTFYCGFLDNSGKSKVITIYEGNANMLEYDSARNALYMQASAPIDSNVVSYKNVTFTELNKGVNGLLMDGVLTGGGMNTQVLYYDQQQGVLLNPLFKQNVENITQRSKELLSHCFGDNMEYEIPSITDRSTEEDGVTDADFVSWNRFVVSDGNDYKLEPSRSTVINYPYAYAVAIPANRTLDSFDFLTRDNGAILSFFETSAENPLFEIRVFKIADWEAGNNTEKYQLIRKDNSYAYTFRNYHRNTPAAPDDDTIKNAFSPLDKGIIGNIR